MFTPGPYPTLPVSAWAPEEWNVCFTGWPEIRDLWDRFSPPPLRHVVAWGYAARADAWVFVDPSKRACPLMLASNEEREGLEASFAAGASALLIRPRGEVGNAQPRLGATCVTVVAQVIGFQTCALRPRAFYRELVADPLTETVRGLQPARNARKPRARREGGFRGAGRPGCEGAP